MSSTSLVALAGLAALGLVTASARADPLPLRVSYRADSGCPGAEVFLEEIRWRTSLARAATGDEPALEVDARIVRRGSIRRGRLLLGRGADRVDRSIDGESCDEVVSALALVTALAIDPHASMAAKPPPRPEPEPTAPPAPPPPTPPPPRVRAPQEEPPPEPVAAREPPPQRWLVGARLVTDLGVAPNAVFGGGVFAERPFDAWWRPALRFAIDAGGTGGFDAGPGGASFLRAVGRLQGCAFEVRVVGPLSLTPCVELQGGALHAEGSLRGSLTFVRQTTIAWFGAGAVPRLGLGLGPALVELQGGPVFPFVRHDFVFQSPTFDVYRVPAVSWTLGLGVGGHIP